MATEVEMGRRQFAIEQLYKKYLGREPEAAGLEYWMNSGEPLESVEWNIANSKEAQDFAAASELDIFEDTTADDTTADTTDDIDTGERLYDYTNQREDGGSQNLYWNNYTRQVTASELEELYNAPDNSRVREAFGTFDNYMAYMDERQDLIEEGELKADWWDTGVALVDPESLDREAGMDDRALEGAIIDEGVNQAQQGYQAQEDVFTNLYEKYTGESVVKYLDNGAKYEWNGTSFVMTQEAYGAHLGSIVGSVIPAIVIGAGLGPAGSGVFGSGAGGGAARGAISSMIGQYVSTGSVDPSSVAQSAALGGIGGFFDDVVNATPGTYGGWVVNGEIVGAPGQFAIEKIQYLSRTLGIPFDEAAGIVEGILTGAINGEDLEGIAINAVAGWGDAKASQYIRDTLGADGIDVDNFFREGSTNISTQSIQGLVSNGIQALVDGGMSDVDVFKTMYQFIDEGGSLDFLWPALGKLDIDFDAEFGGLPNFCELFPSFPLCTDGGPMPEVCTKDDQGNKPWYCGVDIDIQICSDKQKDEGGIEVRIGHPDSWFCKMPDTPDGPDIPDIDIELCTEEELEKGGYTVRIGDKDSWFCKIPQVTVELCTEEELNQGGYTVRIGDPDSWFCKIPDIGVKVCSDEQKAQGGIEIKIGNPDSWYCQMPEIDVELCTEEELNQGGYTVRIGNPDSWFCKLPDVPDIELCTEEELAQGGYTVRIGDKDSWYCKLPNINVKVCSDEELAQGGIEIKIGDPSEWYCEIPDIKVCSEEELAKGGKEIRIGDPDSWYCEMPEIPDIVVCSDEQKAQGGKEIRIGDPDSWYCEMPDIGCEDQKIPNGVQKFKKNSLGECIPDVVECIEGFDFDGQQCVEITLPCPPTKVRNEQTGECECPEGQEENALGLCVDPDDSCPTGQQRDPETGQCVDIEIDGPDIDTPDVSIPKPSMPKLVAPKVPTQGMMTPQINTDAQLLTKAQFPIVDYLSEMMPKQTKDNIMKGLFEDLV